MRVAGWAIDPETVASIDVHVYVDDAMAGGATASLPRPDVAAAYPEFGEAHGFDVLVPATPGRHHVCVYAINVEQGTINPELGCRDVNVLAEDDAAFVRQQVPTMVEPGDTFAAAITVRNTGWQTWTTAGGYRLGSYNPRDNTTWALGRVDLPVAAVAPGQSVTFEIEATAPLVRGRYNFQWQMVRENVRGSAPRHLTFRSASLSICDHFRHWSGTITVVAPGRLEHSALPYYCPLSGRD